MVTRILIVRATEGRPSAGRNRPTAAGSPGEVGADLREAARVKTQVFGVGDVVRRSAEARVGHNRAPAAGFVGGRGAAIATAAIGGRAILGVEGSVLVAEFVRPQA